MTRANQSATANLAHLQGNPGRYDTVYSIVMGFVFNITFNATAVSQWNDSTPFEPPPVCMTPTGFQCPSSTSQIVNVTMVRLHSEDYSLTNHNTVRGSPSPTRGHTTAPRAIANHIGGALSCLLVGRSSRRCTIHLQRGPSRTAQHHVARVALDRNLERHLLSIHVRSH